MRPEDQMRRLRDEDRWSTDAPEVRTRVVPARVQALHWAVTVVVVGALVAGALTGVAALRSARTQVADDRGALSASEIVGQWRGDGQWSHQAVSFSLSTWSAESGCAAKSGQWSLGLDGGWTSSGGSPAKGCVVDAVDGPEPGAFIAEADRVELVGDRLSFLRAGALLGSLLRIDPATVPDRMRDDTDALLGSWDVEGATERVTFARNSAWEGEPGDLEASFALSCSDFHATAPVAAVGDALTIAGAEMWDGDCGENEPLPDWVAEVRHFRVLDSDRLELTDASKLRVVILDRDGAAPAREEPATLTGLPSGATPIGPAATGSWIVPDTDAERPQVLTLEARSFTATSSDRCHPAGGAWATDADGHWSTGGYSGMTAVACPPDPGRGPFASEVTTASAVGMVGDRLEFFDEFGNVIVSFVRK